MATGDLCSPDSTACALLFNDACYNNYRDTSTRAKTEFRDYLTHRDTCSQVVFKPVVLPRSPSTYQPGRGRVPRRRR